MKGAKIGTLFLVMIMSLAGVGASYATWTKSVDIGAAVTTGYLDFKIEDIQVINANGATITPVKYSDYLWGITVSDTYPGWIGYINVLHRNAGTVPLKFYGFQVLDLVGPTDLQNGYTLKFYTPTDVVNIWGTLYQFTDMQYYEGSGTNHWGVLPQYITLTQGQGQWSKVSLDLSQGITGNENAGVTFTLRMWATQA